MAKREKGGFWVGCAAVLFYPLTWLGRSVYRGTDRIPLDGSALLVMNHVSHLDPAVDAVFVHRNRRVPRFMAKDSLFKVPIFGKILGGSGGIPVYRGTADARQSLSAAREALQSDKIVLIYPEGTITKDPDGWPMRARTGVARLALDTDAPIIPVARWGTNFIWDGYHKRFRPLPRKTVYVTVGEPMDLSAYRDKPQSNEVLREVTDLLMNRVRELLAEVRQEQAPAEFFLPSKAARKSKEQDGEAPS
ncbi:MAG: 1-acyl-sn-glycerol-3-phosphate acyltransferase [Pseudonocardiaceae bacterium]|nr:1-acyl-sn-glycerol-3-phosphate acyltransferase [Pseudonocardiaceae bacterium]